MEVCNVVRVNLSKLERTVIDVAGRLTFASTAVAKVWSLT